jgi:hypothetical protein
MINTFWKLIASKLFWGLLRHILSDKLYAKVRYRLELDRYLNLADPRRFTEKIQYIKLYERTKLRQQVADRTQVRSYVARKAGENYLIPLIGVFDELTSENWENLPSQFVLKANHGCGMLEIVRDKNQADFQSIRKKSERWKSTNYYRFGREWVYKDIPRTIVAEKLILDSSGSIPSDYKFFCFDGQVEVIQVDVGRFKDQRRNLYDRNFNRLQTKLLYPNFEGSPDKPALLDEAIEVAEKLSANFNFIRVDLYVLENHVYFGELTNYPGNGFIPFEPDEMEYKMGSLLKL